MNRRSFLRALGLGAAAISLSPLLDFAPIEPVVSAAQLAQFDTLLRDIYAPMIAEMLNARSPLYDLFRRA